ncbi:cytochrome P450 family protein [Nocardia brevicatena]|uniref:cytochrome P450 family protein n=1 Tax=Nocardia brevicatena TaxID=37327 RepID=UPI00031598F8|nr:cytochrome P450 [Nocardia brevicatena]
METQLEPLVLDPSGADIHGEVVRMRARGPVTPVELPGGVRAWAINSAAALRKVLASPLVSRNPRLHWPAFINGEITPEWSLFPSVSLTGMLTAYGKDHRRLRKLVAPAFTQQRTAALRPWIEEITTAMLDELAAAPDTEPVDIRERYAYPVPLGVITELMGVPESFRPALRNLVARSFDTSLTAEQSRTNFAELCELIAELIAYRRAHPGEDMTSLLIAHRDEEETSLTEQELMDTLILVIGAGHETTVNLLDQAIFTLLANPGQRADLMDGRVSVSWSDLMEETLRFQAPVAHLPLRFAVQDLEVEGVWIGKGDAILPSFAAANLDPEVYGDTAGEFDASRKNKSHMAFGHGAHHCLGASLARLEAGVALPAIFERFPRMRLAVPAEELRHLPSFMSNGHHELPVYLNGS